MIDVVGQSADGEDLLRKVKLHKPDVAIVDVRMPPTHTCEGLDAALTIREQMPQIGLLVFSQDIEKSKAFERLAQNPAGVGYLLKDRVADFDHFIEALHRVARGGTVLDPQIVKHLIGRSSGDDPLQELSKREHEVIQLMAEGRANQAIARRLVVSQRSVEQHITNIFRKLDLELTPDDHRRVLAVLTYLRGT